MNPPCYRCEDRDESCHGRCDRYLDWKKEHEKRLREDREERRSRQIQIESFEEASRRGRVGKWKRR